MKILIIGCSHSQGSYRQISKSEKGHPRWVYAKEEIFDSYENAWWSFLNLKKYEIDVISIGGGGYLSYYEIITSMNLEVISKYSYIIIQETSEPRIRFLSFKNLQNFNYKFLNFQKDFSLDNKKLYVCENFNDLNLLDFHPNTAGQEVLKHDYFVNCPKLANGLSNYYMSDLFNNLPKLVGNLLIEYLKQFDIKIFVWKWSKDLSKNIILYENNNIINLMKIYNWTNVNILTNKNKGHSTKEGNKNIGQVLNNLIQDYI